MKIGPLFKIFTIYIILILCVDRALAQDYKSVTGIIKKCTLRYEEIKDVYITVDGYCVGKYQFADTYNEFFYLSYLETKVGVESTIHFIASEEKYKCSVGTTLKFPKECSIIPIGSLLELEFIVED